MIIVVMVMSAYHVAVFKICVSNSRHVSKPVKSIMIVVQGAAHLVIVPNSFAKDRKVPEIFVMLIESVLVANAFIKLIIIKIGR